MMRVVVGWALVSSACGYQALERLSLCDQVPQPAACQQACEPSGPSSCPAGYHCSTGATCDRACTPDGNECGAGMRCTADGSCESTGGPPGDGCPALHATITPVIPTVELVIDASGSMNDAYGPTTRWDALRTALISPTLGVVPRLAHNVVFGATLYSATPTICPILRTQARARDNYDPIVTLLDASEPIQNTPTGEAVAAVANDFAANPPAAGSPPIIVLATDGLPGSCTIPNPSPAQQAAVNAATVQAVQVAFAQGIKTYYLFVGSITTAGSHPQEMANAGVGLGADGAAPVYAADDPAALTQALGQVIDRTLSCDLPTHQQVALSDAPNGTVIVDGTTLRYPDDWTWTADPGGLTIHLLGAACDGLRHAANQTVDATFPCGG